MKFVKVVCAAVCVLFIMEARMFGMEQKQQVIAIPSINSNVHNKKVSVLELLLLLIQSRMPYAFELMKMYEPRCAVQAFPDLIQKGICTALSHQTGFDKDLLAIRLKVARVDWSFMYTTTFEWHLKQLICELFKFFIDEKFIGLDELYAWIMKDVQYQIKRVEESKKTAPTSSAVQTISDFPARSVSSSSSSASSSSKAGALNPFAYLTENLLPDEENKSENKESKA
jgi:hypothetical protein